MTGGTAGRFQTALLLIAVFAAGGLAGAAIERQRSHASEPRPESREGRGRGDRGDRNGLPSFLRDLDLTEAQRAEVERILEAARPESDSLLRITMPRLRELTRRTRAAIREILTPEQQARLDERLERSRGRSRGRRERSDRDSVTDSLHRRGPPG